MNIEEAHTIEGLLYVEMAAAIFIASSIIICHEYIHVGFRV